MNVSFVDGGSGVGDSFMITNTPRLMVGPATTGKPYGVLGAGPRRGQPSVRAGRIGLAEQIDQ